MNQILCLYILIFPFSHLPVETWKEVFEFCTRKELGKGVSLANYIFNAISDPIMHEKWEHPLPDLVLNGTQQELPTFEVPKNITAGNCLFIG